MLQLHLKYILNKYNLITICLILGIYLISLLINIFSIPKDLMINELRDAYFYNVTIILKLVITILIVFIISLSSTNFQESYQLFIIDTRKKRIIFYLTKVFVFFIITVFIVFLVFLLFILIGLISSKWFVIELRHCKFFIFLGLNSFMYGIFTYCLIKFLNSLIVVTIPCFIIIFQEALLNTPFIKYMSYLFPIIINGVEPSLSYGIIHLIMLIFLYTGIGLIKIYTLDIK